MLIVIASKKSEFSELVKVDHTERIKKLKVKVSDICTQVKDVCSRTL